MKVNYTKKQLAAIFTNHDVEGTKYTESDINDNMVLKFNELFGNHLDTYPNYDPYKGDDYNGKEDDDFMDLIQAVVALKGVNESIKPKKRVTLFENVVSKKISKKRKEFIFESLVESGKLKVTKQEKFGKITANITEKLENYFSNNASKDQILKYFGVGIYEAFINEHCDNAIKTFINSVVEDMATPDDLDKLISLIDSGEYSDLEKVEQLKNCLYHFAGEVTSANAGTPEAIELSQMITRLSQEIHAEKEEAAADTRDVVGTIQPIVALGEDQIEALLIPDTNLRLVETRNGISKVYWGGTHYFLKEHLLIKKQQPVTEQQSFTEIPATTFNSLETGSVYNYQDKPVKFDSVVPSDDFATQLLFVVMLPDGGTLMIGIEDVQEIQSDAATLNSLLCPDKAMTSVTFEILDTYNFKIIKKSDEKVTLQGVLNDLGLSGVFLRADSDSKKWYLSSETCGMTWDFTTDSIDQLNNFGSYEYGKTNVKPDELNVMIAIEEDKKDITKFPNVKVTNPKHESYDKVFPAIGYTQNGVKCKTDDGECLILDGEYEGVNEGQEDLLSPGGTEVFTEITNKYKLSDVLQRNLKAIMLEYEKDSSDEDQYYGALSALLSDTKENIKKFTDDVLAASESLKKKCDEGCKINEANDGKVPDRFKLAESYRLIKQALDDPSKKEESITDLQWFVDNYTESKENGTEQKFGKPIDDYINEYKDAVTFVKGIKESLSVNEEHVEVDGLPYTAILSCNGDSYYIQMIPKNTVTLDKIADKGRDVVANQLKSYLSSTYGVTGDYDSEHESAGLVFKLSKDDYQKIPFYKLNEDVYEDGKNLKIEDIAVNSQVKYRGKKYTVKSNSNGVLNLDSGDGKPFNVNQAQLSQYGIIVTEKFVPKGNHLKDPKEFETHMGKIGDFNTKRNPQSIFVTDYFHKGTGKLIGKWDHKNVTGEVIDDELNEEFTIQNVAAALQSKFDTTLLRLAYLYLYKEDPYSKSNDELINKITDHFIKNPKDDKSYNLIFKANEVLGENDSLYDKVNYFDVLDVFSNKSTLFENSPVESKLAFLADAGIKTVNDVNVKLSKSFNTSYDLSNLLEENLLTLGDFLIKS